MTQAMHPRRKTVQTGAPERVRRRPVDGASLGRSAVLSRARIDRRTLDHLVRCGAFPAPMPPRFSTWNAEEVEAWLQERAAAGESQ